MIKHICMSSSNAARGTHGDCFRACIASILDIENIEDVPHWMDPNKYDPDEWQFWFTEWCATMSVAPVFIGISADDDPHEFMGGTNQRAFYILIGDNGTETHCAIYRDGKLVHDPAWFPSPIVRPPAGSDWQILVLTKL